ncbi:GMC family oxidoreductase [Amycolatopsis sp. WGS_07]|uniref:GMC family oxidoreductase n=1 Tax=Amycolatopsis sp. WGS_07 TaxID=3076764 RepID=UPI0038730931
MADSGWDLIVVGAGSSGAALAVRSAQRGKRVLLLEAGPDYRSAEMHEAWRSPNPIVALLHPTAAESLVWQGLDATRTDRQQPALYWRGRGVGGSSSINGQIAIRPPMADFADWAVPGWAPEDVLPYFAKLEDDEVFGDEPGHGRGGPIPIYRTPQENWGAVDAALHRSAIAAGYGWAPDVNAPAASGVAPYPINSRAGRRVSVNDAYLEPSRELPKLTIRGDALVDQVLFEGNRAIGVRVVLGGTVVTELADTVVLSAGAIHTPAILQRSGVGPAARLRSLGIDVRADLPAGRGLQDHPIAMVQLPLTEAAAIKTPDDRHTNVCVRFTSGSGAPEGDLMFVSMNQSVLAMAFADTGAGAGAYGVWLNQNYSRGEVSLVSADPDVQPLVRQRMLSDERDLPRLRAGVRALVELARATETAPILGGSLESANEALFAALDDDRALDDHLLATAGDSQHATSTCRMGDPGDPDTVVDSDCRVLGFERLRVVDASIFPYVPRANTNLAAIMAGELMADRLG